MAGVTQIRPTRLRRAQEPRMRAGRWQPSDLTLVVLCGGRSARFGGDVPKPLVPIHGKPLVWHVVNFWQPANLVVVASREFMLHPVAWSPLDGPVQYVIQDEPRGIAHAIARVREFMTGRFIVALGDCIQRGSFIEPDNMVLGVGAHCDPGSEMLRRSNLLLADPDNRLTTSVEKPHLYTGMGTYFFDQRIFGYIDQLKPSVRGELEVNDLLQELVNDGEPVHCVPFRGEYLNVTYAEDIAVAEALLA